MSLDGPSQEETKLSSGPQAWKSETGWPYGRPSKAPMYETLQPLVKLTQTGRSEQNMARNSHMAREADEDVRHLGL